jgi:hypothetical protein
LVVAVVLPLTWAAATDAGASTAAPPKSLIKGLLPSSYFKAAGFSKVAEKVTTTTKTGQKTCPSAAEVAYETTSGRDGLVSELVACTSVKAAAALLAGARTGTSTTSGSPPKQLGSSAIERSSGGSTYEIYWQVGAIVEAVGLTTDVPASTSSSTKTTTPAPPMTSAQHKLLSGAAVTQNALPR